jgi:hypothetical protein
MHRFIWDMHYAPLDALTHDYPISAIYGDTPLAPQGPLALPGNYTVRLTIAGKTYTAPLLIKGDPRVNVSPGDLKQQFDIEQKIAGSLHQDYTALQQVRSLRAQLKAAKGKVQGGAAEAVNKLDQQAETFEASAIGPAAAPTGAQGQSLSRLNSAFAHLFEVVQSADAAPTAQAVAAVNDLQQVLAATLMRWNEVKQGVPAVSRQVQSAGLPAIDLERPARSRRPAAPWRLLTILAVAPRLPSGHQRWITSCSAKRARVANIPPCRLMTIVSAISASVASASARRSVTCKRLVMRTPRRV